MWIVLVFYCKFCAFKIILFYTEYFQFFLSRNKPNIHNKIIDISSFPNGLNNLFSSTGVYLKSKVIVGSHKGKICFLIFRRSFQNVHFWGCDIFFLPIYPNQLNFSVVVHFIRFVSLMKHFPLNYQNAYGHQTFQGVTCCKEFWPLHMHGIKQWSCWVVWQIKYTSLPAEDVLIPH